MNRFVIRFAAILILAVGCRLTSCRVLFPSPHVLPFLHHIPLFPAHSVLLRDILFPL